MRAQPPTQVRRAGLLTLLTALPVLVDTAVASPDEHEHRHAHDHDRARAALSRGEVRPLAEILALVSTAVPGDVVEVELEREHGRWVYELKVIATDGRRLEVLVDAADGMLLAHEEDD